MQYFDQDFFEFFEELAQNNHKTWFHGSKKRYERSVKEPFYAFVADLINQIKQHNPLMSISPQECIQRINRDIRFSADKSPYNLHCTAFVSERGGKDKSIPGLFLRFSAEGVGIMGGCYAPSKEQLYAIRSSIAADVNLFQSLIRESDFRSCYGGIRGNANKRLPAALQQLVLAEPLLANNQFYFTAEREAELILQDSLMDEVMQYWHAARPLNEFLENNLLQVK